MSGRSDSLEGFVAVDDIRFNGDSTACDFAPVEAVPTTTTTTTTTTLSTTLITEPPGEPILN